MLRQMERLFGSTQSKPNPKVSARRIRYYFHVSNGGQFLDETGEGALHARGSDRARLSSGGGTDERRGLERLCHNACPASGQYGENTPSRQNSIARSFPGRQSRDRHLAPTRSRLSAKLCARIRLSPGLRIFRAKGGCAVRTAPRAHNGVTGVSDLGRRRDASRAQEHRLAQLLMTVKATIFDVTQIAFMNLDAPRIGSAA